MEYEKKDGKVVGKLSQKNVDTGAGLERIAAVMQKKATAYDTDLFEPIVRYIRQHSTDLNVRAERIVADHIRASIFMIADGVLPANTSRGYVLRRLIRRAVRFSDVLGMPEGALTDLFELARQMYADAYPELGSNSLLTIFTEEESKFRKTLEQGLKEFEKGIDPFILATTYGFPIELTIELAHEKGATIDVDDFKKKMAEHQELSRTSSAGMFKGGLANHNEKTLRLHTATHLLNAALKAVLGENVKQRGSNITEERLRFDFTHEGKMTDEQKKAVEDFVNAKITAALPVVRREMPREEAEKLGAEMEFGAKYPDIVSVYSINDTDGSPISMEFCGGPHVENTGTLGVFSIQKEEASSAGVRRIKAILS